MSITKIKPLASMMILLALAACGGGGSGDSPGGGGGGGTPATPQASSGFAQPTDQIRSNVSFALPQGTWIRQEGGVATTQAPTVTIDFSGVNKEQIYITYNGERHLAQRQAGNGGNFYLLQSRENGQIIRITFDRQLTTSSDVVAGGLATISNPQSTDINSPVNYIQRSHIVYGFDSNPATIAAETGTATYKGSIRANGYQGGNVSSASGTITLNATFDSTDTVSGSFNLDSLSGMTGAHNYTMNTGDISGNGFDGTISVVGSLQPGQTLQSATYDGNFYGSQAEAVGGTINMTIIDGAETPIYIQGAFVAGEQP